MDSVTYVAIPQTEWSRIMRVLEKVEGMLAPKPHEEYLTTEQACRMLGVNKNTFASYRKKFNIKVSQVGRNILTPRSEIEKLIKERSL